MIVFSFHIIFLILAIVLMVGIVLVTKPPFLFPPHEDMKVNSTNMVHDFLDRKFILYDIKAVNWTGVSAKPNNFEYITESVGNYYFVGAVIALSSAIFSALNNIVIAKLV